MITLSLIILSRTISSKNINLPLILFIFVLIILVCILTINGWCNYYVATIDLLASLIISIIIYNKIK